MFITSLSSFLAYLSRLSRSFFYYFHYFFSFLLKKIADFIHFDILRFYVVHKNYENLLKPEILKKLYRYTNELLNITAHYNGKTYHFDEFCEKDIYGVFSIFLLNYKFNMTVQLNSLHILI